MKKDKLLDLLRTFSTKELQRFVDFVDSPYFNRREVLKSFCGYLAELHPCFNQECLQLTALPIDAFTGKEKTKKELSYLKSDLYRLALEFLAHERLRAHPLEEAFQTTLALQGREDRAYVTQLTSLHESLAQAEQLEYQQLMLQYFVTHRLREIDSLRSDDAEEYTQKAIGQLDEFYFITKLSLGFDILNRRQIMNLQPELDNPLLDDIENLLHSSSSLNPRTAIYFQLYLSSKHPGEEQHADHLIELIKRHFQSIPATECRGIYLATINICMRLSRVNATKYLPLSLELYRHGIERQILFENNILTEWTYKNVIKLGLKLQRYDWTEQFIREYNGSLAPDVRKNALASNLAELAFSQRDYDLTLEHLNKIKTKHFKYYLSTKILLIKTFYETQNIESCLSALGAFTVYLSRSRGVSPTVRKNCRHFCQLLHHTLMQSSEKKKEKTKHKILNQTPLTEREWLFSVFQREHPKI